nr:RNA polymerase sigma factor [Paenibacillus soyae]
MVNQAKQGDQTALSELIRLHRKKMLLWANRIVRNTARAEDVVQDALVQTIRRIESLENPDKLMPWLRTLVRNQALMALRSSGYRRETPIDDSAAEEVGPTLLGTAPYDPSLLAIGSHALEETKAQLGRLGERERQVLASHVLEGLTVKETAERHGMNSGAVYTALSRARTKLEDYRFEAELGSYMSARRRSGKDLCGSAVHASYGRYAGAYDTLMSMMTITAASAGMRRIGLTDLFAATGHAFRFHAAKDLGISGPYAFDWSQSVRTGWKHLGMTVSLHGGPGVPLRRPEQLAACMDDMHHALRQGMPVIGWGLHKQEFGLVTGYDDGSGSWAVMDTSVNGKRLSYSELGRGRSQPEWFAAVPGKPLPGTYRNGIASLLLHAVRCIRGEADGMPYSVSGAAAYRLWIDSFDRQQPVEPLSVAYNLAVVAEARSHAAAFLRQCAAGSWHGSAFPEQACAAIHHANRLFERIAESMGRVSELFPLPFGADPAAPGPADRTAQLLSRALQLELEAADSLEEAAWSIQRYSSFLTD